MSIALALLAAGRSSRMGGNHHKLLALFDGITLIRRSALAALGSGAAPVIVVLGHRADDLRKALDGLKVDLVVNDGFASGLSTSLKAAVAQVPSDATGMIVQLADMPGIGGSDLVRLKQVFEEAGGKAIVRATAQGRPGHPVILPRKLLADIPSLAGDIGARELIATSGLPVMEVELGRAATLDVDTPVQMAAAGGILSGQEAGDAI